MFRKKNEKQIKGITIANNILIPEIIRLLNNGHTVTLPLKGYSMRPFLEDARDKALLKKTDSPKVGDPVLAEVKPEMWVLHRIIKIEGDRVTLRGDGNMSNEYCKMSDICASVIGFYRKDRDKLDRTDGMKWKIYSYFWTRLYPIRRWLLAFYRIVWMKIPFIN